eukprot:Sspe_Gene.80557::Locus_50914_Transcript_1_1_Confidence_1.000_Length_1020::g.80557::m.80557
MAFHVPTPTVPGKRPEWRGPCRSDRSWMQLDDWHKDTMKRQGAKGRKRSTSRGRTGYSKAVRSAEAPVDYPYVGSEGTGPNETGSACTDPVGDLGETAGFLVHLEEAKRRLASHLHETGDIAPHLPPPPVKAEAPPQPPPPPADSVRSASARNPSPLHQTIRSSSSATTATTTFTSTDTVQDLAHPIRGVGFTPVAHPYH